MKQPEATASLEIETTKKRTTRSKSPKVDYEAVDMNPKSSTPKKKKKKRSEPDSEPLMDTSPIKDLSKSGNDSSSTKKKKKRPEPDSEPLMDTSLITTPLSSPIKDLSKSVNDSRLVTVGVIKTPKRKKTESRQESKLTETDGHISLKEKSMNKSSLVDTSTTMNEYPSYSNEPVKKPKKKRRSVESPPASSEMDSRAAPDDSNQSIDKLLQESSTIEIKPRDPESKNAEKANGKSKKKAKPIDSSLIEPVSKKRLKSPGSGSKLKTKKAVEESDDLEWVDYAQPVTTNPYDRRKSVDIVNEDMGLFQINSQKRSTSYHDLDKEERKMFREELRQASKSEYNMKEKANGGPKVDIDPDVQVKKSGKVVAKRKKRPTILEADGDQVGNENQEENMTRKKGRVLAIVLLHVSTHMSLNVLFCYMNQNTCTH